MSARDALKKKKIAKNVTFAHKVDRVEYKESKIHQLYLLWLSVRVIVG